MPAQRDVRVDPLDALQIDTSGFPADEPWLHVTPVAFGDRHGLLLSTRQTFKGAGEDGGEQKRGEGGGSGGSVGGIVSELHLFTEDNDGGGGGGSMGRLVRKGQWMDAGDPTNMWTTVTVLPTLAGFTKARILVYSKSGGTHHKGGDRARGEATIYDFSMKGEREIMQHHTSWSTYWTHIQSFSTRSSSVSPSLRTRSQVKAGGGGSSGDGGGGGGDGNEDYMLFYSTLRQQRARGRCFLVYTYDRTNCILSYNDELGRKWQTDHNMWARPRDIVIHLPAAKTRQTGQTGQTGQGGRDGEDSKDGEDGKEGTRDAITSEEGESMSLQSAASNGNDLTSGDGKSKTAVVVLGFIRHKDGKSEIVNLLVWGVCAHCA